MHPTQYALCFLLLCIAASCSKDCLLFALAGSQTLGQLKMFLYIDQPERHRIMNLFYLISIINY